MQRHGSGESADSTPGCKPEVREHLAALGLSSVEEYQRWCTSQGFSPRLEKHWRERCKERYFAAQGVIQGNLARKKREKRQPRHVLEELFRSQAEQGEPLGPNGSTLELVRGRNAAIEDEGVRAAFRQLILFVQGKTKLLASRPALSRLGEAAGNTFIDGLLNLAHHHQDWVRSVETWIPCSCNVHRQFASLADHLLTKYSPPAFFHTAWFRGQSVDARKQQDWYKALGIGRSPRSLDLPFPMTRQMAHHFLFAPKEYLVEEALRWGQVRGLGGCCRLVTAILGSRLGTDFGSNDFWIATIRWLIDNPMFDAAQIGPLIDYVHHQRVEQDESQPEPHGDGFQPETPAFQIRRQTPAALLQRIREWHGNLRRQPERPQLQWLSSGIGPFEFSEGTLASGKSRVWTVTELLSRQDLHLEGQTLRHCVASYDHSCAHGGTSIWSLGVVKSNGVRKRVLTIEVSNRTRVIRQIRGKANRLASQKELDIVRRWAGQEQLVVAGHVLTQRG